MSGRMKLILNGDLDDGEALVRLIRQERESFTREWLKNGHGWGYKLSNGRAYFLRKITGGVSATLSDPALSDQGNTTPPATGGA